MSVYSTQSALRDAYVRDLRFFPNAREFGTTYLVDVNSAIRNSASTVSAFRPVPTFFSTTLVGASASLGGVVGVPLGLSIVRDGFLKAKHAFKWGDVEGAVHKSLWGAAGAGYAGASGVLAADGILTLANQSIPAAINPAFAGLGLVLYGSLLVHGAYGYIQTAKFGRELQRALNSGGDLAAIDFLKSQILLSKEEIAKYPEKEWGRLLQKKWNQFELRTNANVAALARQTLLFETDPKLLHELIIEVQKANHKEKVKHILFIVLALLGIAASIFVILSTGPISPIFFAIGAVLWLAIDSSALHNWVGDYSWRKWASS